MKLSRLAYAVVLVLPGAAAFARLNPTPPPSGIVIHLFGPDSITSHVLPTFTGPAGAPAAGAPAAVNRPPAGAAGVGNGTETGAAMQPGGVTNTTEAATAPASSTPTMGEVLHQMFVVGDPSLTPAEKMAPGRAAEHPQAVNP